MPLIQPVPTPLIQLHAEQHASTDSNQSLRRNRQVKINSEDRDSLRHSPNKAPTKMPAPIATTRCGVIGKLLRGSINQTMGQEQIK